ncbi:unnamed protein product [Nippostrongylus brasiliensis]|uniref:Carbohydrate sulfotransferase n=1 Tax=Nippostrongylus brasiliensis TaxID=27835 RepID=A0A0N4Y1Q0_NIPBR|nr:unnamed protein product [Nippostrongylus brasiliensis]
MRARLFAAASLLVSAAVFYYRINAISKAPLDIRSENTSSQKEVCQGLQSRLEQVRRGTFTTAPFNRSHLLPPLIEYTEEFHIAPPYHVLICRIPKVMSTVLDAAFCYITNSTEFKASNRTISNENGGQRYCRNQNIANNLAAAVSAAKPLRLQLAIVRHPIERFLSGFVNKCLNNTLGNTKNSCSILVSLPTCAELLFNNYSRARRDPTMCYSCKREMKRTDSQMVEAFAYNFSSVITSSQVENLSRSATTYVWLT